MRPVGERVKCAIFIVVVAALAYLTITYWQTISSTLRQHTLTVAYAGCLSVAGITVQVLNFLLLLDSPAKPAFRPTVRAWALANLANYLGPFQPGLAVRAAFFKANGITISATALTTLRQLHLSVWTALCIGSAGLVSDSNAIRMVGAASLCAFLAWFVVLHVLRKYVRRLKRRAGTKQCSRPLNLMTRVAPPVPGWSIWLSVAQHLLIASSLFGVYWSFGAQLTISGALLLAVASSLSTLIAITPSNLGIQEALFGIVALEAGLSVGSALTMGLVFRLGHIAACLSILALTFMEFTKPDPAQNPNINRF